MKNLWLAWIVLCTWIALSWCNKKVPNINWEKIVSSRVIQHIDNTSNQASSTLESKNKKVSWIYMIERYLNRDRRFVEKIFTTLSSADSVKKSDWYNELLESYNLYMNESWNTLEKISKNIFFLIDWRDMPDFNNLDEFYRYSITEYQTVSKLQKSFIKTFLEVKNQAFY